MKTPQTSSQDNLPTSLFIKSDFEPNSFGLYAIYRPGSLHAIGLATFYDKTRALRAGEQISGAFGAEWCAENDPRYPEKAARP